MPIYAVTRRASRHEIARAFTDLVATSGSLASPTITSIASPVLIQGQSAHLQGAELSFYAGGGASLADSARVISAFTPYSAPTFSPGGIASVQQQWSAAPSTNSGWEIHRLFSRQQYDDAITRAVRRMGRRMMLPAEEYQVVRSGLRNAAFDYWGSGTSSAPNQWTLGGTSAAVARESTIVYQGRYSCRLTSAASQTLSLTQTAQNIGQFAGTTITLRAMVYTVTASRVTIRVNDGSTNYNSTAHSGASGGDGVGQWRELSVEVAVPSTATGLDVSLQISSGASVVAYLGKVWIDGLDDWEVPLEMPWVYIQDIYVEDSDDEFIRVPREWWFLNKDRSPRSIGFIRDFYTPLSGNAVKVVGQQYPAVPGEEDNLPVDPEYVFNRAAAELAMALPGGAADWKGWAQKAERWEARADEIEKKSRTRPYLGSRALEDV